MHVSGRCRRLSEDLHGVVRQGTQALRMYHHLTSECCHSTTLLKIHQVATMGNQAAT